MNFRLPYPKINRGTLIFFILFLAAGLTAYYFYNDNRQKTMLLKNPDLASKEEVKALTAQVGKLMELPQGEEPQLVTVLDKEKLKDQKFFDKSQNDDKVLIYMKAKQAILYRPSTNKIIDIGPLEVTNQNFTATIYTVRGNKTTDQVEKTITDQFSNIGIARKDAAKKSDYAKNLVVDVNGDKGDDAKKLAEAIGADLGGLPEGEDKPNTDFLIILAP